MRLVANGYRRAVALVAATSFVGGFAEALFLVIVTRFAFAVTDGADEVGIIADWFLSTNQTLVLATALVMVRIALSGFAVWQTARISNSVVARLRTRMSSAFLSAAWEVQQGEQGGSLQQLVMGFSARSGNLMTGLTSSIVAFFNLLAMLGLAVAVDPAGSLVMLVSVVVFAALLRPIRVAVKRRTRLADQARMRLAVLVNETSQLGMELHVFNVQDRAEQRLLERISTTEVASRRTQIASSSMSTVYSGLAYLALLVALGVAAQSSSGSLTSIGAVMLVMLRSLSYGQKLQSSYLGVIGAAPAIDEWMQRVEAFEAGRRSDLGAPVGTVGAIEVDHVSFAYPGDPAVLHDVDFRIEPGEIVGIVGPSGGGKSTLVQLMLALRDPTSGSIRANGRDISTFSKAEWVRKVTFVPQSAQLVAGTVGDNIRFMRTGISDEAVERAARLAHLHDDVMGFPDAYDRSVGERGGHLSGGQQQRLCIARALVEDPDVLILDEPTSALDVQSEHLVRSTLLELKERMTVVVIAHRLSTLDICDRIMVIEDGRIRGFDTPTRLEESSTFYREALRLSGLR